MVKRPVVLEVPLVLDSFYLICRFPENDCSFDGLLTLIRESGRHSKSSVKAVAIFLFLAIKSTLITVPCKKQRINLRRTSILSVKSSPANDIFDITRYILLLHVYLPYSFHITDHFSDPTWLIHFIVERNRRFY